MTTPLGNTGENHIYLVNKPLHWTSFDVINKIRIGLKIKKAGHAGTLDPLATGLLIVCTGKLTKRIKEFMSLEKEYTGSMTLGATTPTYDLESEPGDFKSTEGITIPQIRAMTKKFIGGILQVPPAHSAVKIGGKRGYELARKGKEVSMTPRNVHIEEFEITRVAMPVVEFRVVCSTGTYIRSLVHDFGLALGCGAYLSALCRTRIGEYALENAQEIEEIIQSAGSVRS